ncbi:MAG: MlaC/ttg2D family ABC transporter substrate-binding protein [Halothiobacillaceae bacterium]
MKGFKTMFGVALLAGLLAVGPLQAAGEDGAQAVVAQTIDEVIAAIQDNRAALEADPDALLGIVDEILLPRVDFDRMSRLTLGRYWNRASADERARFQAQYRKLLVRTYAGPLSSVGDQQIDILGVRDGTGPDDVMVRSEVRDGVESIPVDYRMHRDDDGWKAYDVVIDGISLINNYRGSFGQTIQREGMAGLIRQLEERNQ